MDNLANAIRGIAEEIDRLDVPGLVGGVEDLHARIDRVLQQQYLMQERVHGLHGELHNSEERLRQEIHNFQRETRQELSLLPMKSFNLSRNDDETLWGRYGHIPDPYPNTINALRTANTNQLNALAVYLEIQFRRNMTVNQRRAEIARFLGVRVL